MLFLIVSFLAAFVVTLLVVRSSAHHAHLSGDTDKDQPQKFHARVVPRVGGIGILTSLFTSVTMTHAITALIHGRRKKLKTLWV